MSIFLETNHLFLRNPHGGVEDVNAMKAAGFNAIFLNIKDYPLTEWDIVRANAEKANVVCGPWARTTQGSEFDPNLLQMILDVATEWGDTPLIVNSEAELKGSGSDLTTYINEQCLGRDWALSMEPIPFANVDWYPIEAPVLPQCFGPEWAGIAGLRQQWQAYGVKCVVATFGTYSGWQPDLYPLDAPYGLYTADDCGNQFSRWQAKGYANPCAEVTVPPTNGDDMEKIGSQHGVTASMNRLRDLDPGGTLLQKQGDKWPPLSSLTEPVEKWKAFDKLERSLTILVTDHDAEV